MAYYKNPPNMRVEDRPPKPFCPGDIVVMAEAGFSSFQHGDLGTVSKVSWGNSCNEWCIMVYNARTGVGQWYRASRFKLVEKGPRDMIENTYAFFKLRTTPGDNLPTPDPDTLTIFTGSYKEAEEMARTLLKDDPEARYVYGRLDTLAKVEAPPVKFTKL